MAKPTLFLIALVLLFLSSLSYSKTVAEEKEDVAVYIVFVDEPAGEEPEAFHVRTLAAVLGSEEAADQAILFHYKYAAYGFAAKLTLKQAEKLKKQPGVLEVIPSRTYHIHDPTTSDRAHLSVT